MSNRPIVENLFSRLLACKKTRSLAEAKSIHKSIRDHGLEIHAGLGNHLVPLLVQCGSILDAEHAFHSLSHRNVHSWTSLIQGYIECGECARALGLFRKMQQDLVRPNQFTFLALLKACSRLKCVESSYSIHRAITFEGLDTELVVCNALLDVYVKCCLLEDAQNVFGAVPARDVVSWTTLIAGYADLNRPDEALRYLTRMQVEGVEPNAITFFSSLKACANSGAIESGRAVHANVVREGFEMELLVGSNLVDMYVKSGLLAEAQTVFDALPGRNVVLWTTLMAGYVDQGYSEKALTCYEQMQVDGLSPDTLTFTCSLRACGSLGAIDKGRSVHAELAKEGYERDPLIGSTLVDMYAKCGSLFEGAEVFDEMAVLDVVSWTALTAGYAHEGESELLFQLVERMVEEKVTPNETTFLSILTVCSHTGLVDKGMEYFEIMSKCYTINPNIRHHNCMVDLLSRAGQLDEAAAMLECMPIEPNLVTWETMLNACWKMGNTELGKHSFEIVLGCNESHTVPYKLMSNIYADVRVQQCG